MTAQEDDRVMLLTKKLSQKVRKKDQV